MNRDSKFVKLLIDRNLGTRKFRNMLIDITGNINDALVLETIIERFQHEGELIERDGRLWTPIKRYDWWEICRLTPRQADASITRLVKSGIIDKAIFKLWDAPTSFFTFSPKMLEYYYWQQIGEAE